MSDRSALHRRLNARLLDLAERVAAPYAADGNVRAVLLTGSLARGRADLDSDVDLILYLEEPVSAERFEAAYRRPLVEAVRAHRTLIDELPTLVEREMPTIDTAQQRAFRERSYAVGSPMREPFAALAEASGPLGSPR